MVIKSFDKILR